MQPAIVAKPVRLAPHPLIKWTWSGAKLFGGLLDFPGRPGMSYFLAYSKSKSKTWLGMKKKIILNTKYALTIFFTQCYLAAILRSASSPLKHPTIQLVYWAEIAHLFPSSTSMVASFDISLFLFSAHPAPEMHSGWADSCEGWIRCHRKLSCWENHPGTCLCIHILMRVLCLDIMSVFIKGTGWGVVVGWGLGLVWVWLIMTGWIVRGFSLYLASIVPICLYRVVFRCE